MIESERDFLIKLETEIKSSSEGNIFALKQFIFEILYDRQRRLNELQKSISNTHLKTNPLQSI